MSEHSSGSQNEGSFDVGIIWFVKHVQVCYTLVVLPLYPGLKVSKIQKLVLT